MGISREELKRNAKARLTGRWGWAILVVVLSAVISYVVSAIIGGISGFNAMSMIMQSAMYGNTMHPQQMLGMLMNSMGSMFFYSILTFAVGIFVLTQIEYGVTYWYYKLARGHNPEISDMFYFFKSGGAYKNAIFLGLNVGIRTVGWMLLVVYLPAMVMAIFVGVTGSGVVAFLTAIVMIAGGIALAFIVQRYSLAFTLMCDADNQINTTEAIRRSISATEGKRGEMLLMELSFIGWFLLCIFIIPILYVGPYFQATLMEEYRYIADTTFGRPADLAGQMNMPAGAPPNMGAQQFNQPMEQQFQQQPPIQPMEQQFQQQPPIQPMEQQFQQQPPVQPMAQQPVQPPVQPMAQQPAPTPEPWENPSENDTTDHNNVEQ